MSVLVLGDFYYDYDYITSDIIALSKLISEHEWSVVLNLEGAIVNDKTYEIKKRGEHLAQGKIIGEVLKLLNVKGVSLSNNHIFDYGVDGVKNTISVLNKLGIVYCGIYLKEHDVPDCMLIEDKDGKFMFSCATDPFEESVCSCNGLDGCLKIETLLGKAPNKNYSNIAFLHTGFEYNTLPTIRTIKECRTLIDNDYECVVCSHPHIVQPYENYAEKSIFYSIGNFYFSSFREEFELKRINNKSEGYCSLGAGIVIFHDKVKHLLIKYDGKKNESRIKLQPCLDRLDFTNLKSYTKSFYDNRNNHNFMLTGNSIGDGAKMKILNFMYYAYRKIRRL